MSPIPVPDLQDSASAVRTASQPAVIAGRCVGSATRSAPRWRPFCALLLATPLLAIAAEPQVQCPANDPNLKTYLEMTARMFQPRDAAQASRFYAAEFVSHNQDSGGGGPTRLTPAVFQKVYGGSLKTYGERKMENDLILCAGDMVVARVIMTAKMTGPLGAQAATGRTSRTSAIDIYRFKDGKVVERWGNNDGISQLWQLGLLLPPAPPRAPETAAAK